MAALGDARRKGLTRHIGVSNFTIATLAEAMRVSPEPIVTNQIEYHPYLDQRRLLAAIRGHGLAITAYCPIALGKVVGDPDIAAIARAHNKTNAQVDASLAHPAGRHHSDSADFEAGTLARES